MNTKNITTLVLTAIIGVILVTAVLIPIISNAMDSNKTIKYNSYGVGASYFDDEEHVITYDGTTATLDGTTMEIGNSDAFGLLLSENMSIYVTKGSPFTMIMFTMIDGVADNPTKTGATGLTITINGNSISVALVGASEFNIEVESSWGMYLNSSGDQRIDVVRSWTDYSIYFTDPTQLKAVAFISSDSTKDFYSFVGNDVVKNGTNVGESVINSTIVPNSNGIKSVTIAPESSGTSGYYYDSETPVYPNLVGYSNKIVTYTENGATIDTILFIIPTIAIIGLLVAIVRGFVRT